MDYAVHIYIFGTRLQMDAFRLNCSVPYLSRHINFYALYSLQYIPVIHTFPQVNFFKIVHSLYY